MRNLSILICLLALACTRGEDQGSSEIFIDTSLYPAEAVNIEDLIEEVYLIPLETTPDCAIGTFWKYDQNKSNIFYLSKQDLTIYRFTSEGKYVNKFNHMGKGPGEYTRIRHFEILPYSETILISSPSQKKMIQYRNSGEFINEFQVPPSSGQFKVLDENVIALHVGRMAAMSDSTLRHDLIFIDLEGNTLASHFPHDKPLNFEFGLPFSQPNSDGSFYYSKQFDFNLYRIKDTAIPEAEYQFNYSNKMASYADLDGPDARFMSALTKAGKILEIGNYINTFTQIGLRRYADRKASFTIFNKKTGSLKIMGEASQDFLGKFHGLNIPFPADSYKDYFLSSIDATDFVESLENLDADQKQYLSKKVKGFKSATECKEDSNPILIYFKFKSF